MTTKRKYTTSDKVIAANQRNALKSTGPKDTEKTKFNAVTHGLYSMPPQATQIYSSRMDQIAAELQERFLIAQNDPKAALALASASFHLAKTFHAYEKLTPRDDPAGIFGFGTKKPADDFNQNWIVFRHEARAMQMLEKLEELSKGGDER